MFDAGEGSVGAAAHDDDLEVVVDLLADQRLDRPVDHGLVVLGDDHRRDCRPTLLADFAETIDVAALRAQQHGQVGRPFRPRCHYVRVRQQPGVVLLEVVARVRLAILVEPRPSMRRRQTSRVLDADAREQPALPRDATGHRHEMQALRPEWRGGVEGGEQAEHPHRPRVVVVLVVDHPKHLGAVGEPGLRLGFEEPAQRLPVGIVDAFVGVEEQQPARPTVQGGVDQPLTVLEVVPAVIARPNRVGQHRRDEWMALQDRPSSIRRPVIERHDSIGVGADTGQPARQQPFSVPDW